MGETLEVLESIRIAHSQLNNVRRYLPAPQELLARLSQSNCIKLSSWCTHRVRINRLDIHYGFVLVPPPFIPLALPSKPFWLRDSEYDVVPVAL